MKKKISLKEKFFVAGSTGMVGGAVCRSLKKNGYGLVENGGEILAPKRNELDLLESEKVKVWFKKNEPSVVILAAAKVGEYTQTPVSCRFYSRKYQNSD